MTLGPFSCPYSPECVLPVSLRSRLAKLLILPLSDRDRRGGVCDHQPITDERGLAPKGPKAFIVYQTKRLLSFLRVQIDFPFTNGAAQIRLLAKVREMGILTG